MILFEHRSASIMSPVKSLKFRHSATLIWCAAKEGSSLVSQGDPDSDDFDQVGLTLRSQHREYFVAAVARKNGRPTVEGVSPGDRLIRIGNLQTQNATWGAIYNAMHGKPGQTLILVLERSGNRFAVTAKVTAF